MLVTIEMDVRNTVSDDTMSFNVVAEIPGRDKADELAVSRGRRRPAPSARQHTTITG